MNDRLIIELLAAAAGCDAPDIGLGDTLSELGMSSLDTADFAFEVEKQCGVRLDMTEFPMTGTVKELLLFIENAAFRQLNGAK